jgi:hypothetical protein
LEFAREVATEVERRRAVAVATEVKRRRAAAEAAVAAEVEAAAAAAAAAMVAWHKPLLSGRAPCRCSPRPDRSSYAF